VVPVLVRVLVRVLVGVVALLGIIGPPGNASGSVPALVGGSDGELRVTIFAQCDKAV
jgi:hypothetical protein